MASTNHTAKILLSQFLPGDKPTFLGDYNSDMAKIEQLAGDIVGRLLLLEEDGALTNAEIQAIIDKF